MSEFSFEMEIDTRYRDIDSVGHVNNAVYLTYFEQARIEYTREVMGRRMEDSTIVVANVEINYERPIKVDEAVIIRVRVSDLGNSAIEMDCEIRADGERACTGSSVMVPFDRETQSSLPIPDEWRERIEAHEGREF